ncbi:hypothetical protein D3C80_1266970 [compost metagenome]
MPIQLKPFVLCKLYLAFLAQLTAHEIYDLIWYCGNVRKVTKQLEGLKQDCKVKVKGGLGFTAYPLQLLIRKGKITLKLRFRIRL